MEIWLLILLISTIVAATGAFIWLALKFSSGPLGAKKGAKNSILKSVEDDVEHIFNDEFRQELRNRGRLHFENIIGENAMFLQQDLRLTTSQLNEYLKAEITHKLTEEFAKYEQSINDAKELATQSIKKTQDAIEMQRQALGQELKTELDTEKKRRLERFDKNLADIVNHYIIEAIGNQIDLTDQLEFIIGELKNNKEAILEDLKNGS